jgi:hypothetical protein
MIPASGFEVAAVQLLAFQCRIQVRINVYVEALTTVPPRKPPTGTD